MSYIAVTTIVHGEGDKRKTFNPGDTVKLSKEFLEPLIGNGSVVESAVAESVEDAEEAERKAQEAEAKAAAEKAAAEAEAEQKAAEARKAAQSKSS